MELDIFRRGLLVGFAVAAPVGPIGVLVIQRTLRGGRTLGLATGLGAAAADALFAAVSALATATVARALAHTRLVELAGGLALVALAVRAWRERDTAAAALPPTTSGHARAFGETLLLTLANPATILSFAAVSAGIGLGAGEASAGAALALALSVLLGSAAWWLLLSTGVASLRTKLSPRLLGIVRFASGAVLASFGLAAIAHAVA